jgi:hypothetical protein
MPGIRETRKKLQRSVVWMAANEPPDVALRELLLLKQTVDSQVELLQPKEESYAPDTEAANLTLAETAAQEDPQAVYV